jgi:hypothetical protein
MLFILYIVFALLKINEVLIWIYDLLMPSLATDRFSSDLIRLSVELTKSMVCFQLNLFVSNSEQEVFMLNLEHDHILIWYDFIVVRSHRP